eukprot:scaffold6002_cov376-Prasinococcus_capsulatus_cf.AAC.2
MVLCRARQPPPPLGSDVLEHGEEELKRGEGDGSRRRRLDQRGSQAFVQPSDALRATSSFFVSGLKETPTPRQLSEVLDLVNYLLHPDDVQAVEQRRVLDPRDVLPVLGVPSQPGDLEALLGHVQGVDEELRRRSRHEPAAEALHPCDGHVLGGCQVAPRAATPEGGVPALAQQQALVVDSELDRGGGDDLHQRRPNARVQPDDAVVAHGAPGGVQQPGVELGLPLGGQRRPQQVERVGAQRRGHASHRPRADGDDGRGELAVEVELGGALREPLLHHELHSAVGHDQELRRQVALPQASDALLLHDAAQGLVEARVLAAAPSPRHGLELHLAARPAIRAARRGRSAARRGAAPRKACLPAAGS